MLSQHDRLAVHSIKGIKNISSLQILA
jgi:hypothetical protein